MEPPQHSQPRVGIWKASLHRARATCECGYLGRPHWFRLDAIIDARNHTVDTGHTPSQPIDLWKAISA